MKLNKGKTISKRGEKITSANNKQVRECAKETDPTAQKHQTKN